MGLLGKTGVDEIGLLRKFVDEMGVDEIGCYRLHDRSCRGLDQSSSRVDVQYVVNLPYALLFGDVT